MSNPAPQLVQKLWNYCNILRDDGLSYGDYVEQLTFLLFLKMADEQVKPPFNKPSPIPKGKDWPALLAKEGDEYEGLLQKNAEDVKGGAGQYFTPRPLIAAMVEVVAPQPGQAICDPACGTGGFLLAAHDYVAKHYQLDRAQKKRLKNGTLFGIELVDSVTRLCAMNLLLHGIGSKSDLPLGDNGLP